MAETWDPSEFGLTPAAPATAQGGQADGQQWDPAEFGLTPAAPQAQQAPAAPAAANAGETGGYLAGVAHRFDQATDIMANAATLGLGHMVGAGVDAALGSGGSFMDRYHAARAQQDAQETSVPGYVRAPAELLGGAGAMAGAGGLVAKGASAALDAMPGVQAAASAAPAAVRLGKAAVEGAAIGGAQAATDSDAQNLPGNMLGGAVLGGVAAPVVEGGIRGVVAARNALGELLSESGYGAKNALLDAGAPIVGSAGQQVAATPGVARVAGRQIADAAADPAAVQNALAQPVELVPGSVPTTFQATNDVGLGQLENRLRVSPGSSQAFLARANEQNAARANALTAVGPADASSADLVNSLSAQRSGLATTADASRQAAAQGTLQDVGGVADSAPAQTGAAIRQAVDTARAPALAEADTAVEAGQKQASDALTALGGTVSGDAATAQQQFGQGLRSTLAEGRAAQKALVRRAYDAVDPDGSLALGVDGIKQAQSEIAKSIGPNLAPISGEEAAIHDAISGGGRVQSFRDVQDLDSRIGDALRAERTSASPNNRAIARLTQLQGTVRDAMDGAASDVASAAGAPVQDAVEPGTEAARRTALEAWRDDWYARQHGAAAQEAAQGTTLRGLDTGTAGRVSSVGRGQGQARGQLGNAAGNSGAQSQPELTPNFDADAAQRYADARAANRELKETYDRAPGVGPALRSGPMAGDYAMPDSSVPSAIFSSGKGAAERVQSAIQAGLTPQQIADYAAYDLRRAAVNADGTLDPAKAARWRASNGEAFQALAQADPAIAGRFNTAQQMAQRVSELQAQRTALDGTHPLKPGWGDAEVAQRVWQAGPKGADSVGAVKGLADDALADYAAYSLRKTAAQDGVLNPARYQTWLKAYDGALSARPDIRARFDTAANAQAALDAAADQHVAALKDYEAGVAKHFLGGADPADRMGSILGSQTRLPDMQALARLTANDPAARAGLQQAVVDHVMGRFSGNALAGQTGTTKLKSDQLQTFIGKAVPALREIMTAQQVDMMQKVAADLQRSNLSVDGVRVAGGSDTTQKAALVAEHTGLGLLKSQGLQGLLTVMGYVKGGAVGGFIANRGAAAVSAMRAAGIQQADDLVKEAMLNPALARVLMARLTPETTPNVATAFSATLGRIAAQRLGAAAGHTTRH